MSEFASYDVRVWATEKRKGTRSTSYRVRWTVSGTRFGDSFSTAKLADSFRATLLKAAREGEAFDRTTGMPRSLTAASVARTWVQVAREFIDSRWADASPRHRKSTVDGLVTLTCALVREGRTPPNAQHLRLALTHWEFNPASRARAETPNTAHREALRWIEVNSLDMQYLSTPDGVKHALQAVGLKLDGKKASNSTFLRKRAALSGALNFAVEMGYLSHNPMRDLNTTRRAPTEQVDPRVVVNPDQARRLLAAVRDIEPTLHAFFALLYYAGLRPAEARNLRDSNLSLPESGWGNALLHRGYQESGTAWTDDGSRGEERGLKHRAESETRPVPVHPDLVEILRHHLNTYGTGVSGRLFVTRTGRGGHPIAAPYQNPVSMSTVYRVWKGARTAALSPAQCASPLAARPYDLRHACVSTWLHAGVPTTQVAAWAGHSVAVLLRTYAACLDDQGSLSMRRIEQVLPTARSDGNAPPSSGRPW
jgi:integrase